MTTKKKTKKTKKFKVTVKEAATTQAPAVATTTQASADATTAPVATTEVPVSANPLKAVSLSTKTPKVGDVITVVTDPVDASDVKGYKWFADAKEISGEASASYTVKKEDLGKTIKVVVTNIKDITFESNETAAVIEDNTNSVTISVPKGLQADGTAMNTDDILLTFGSGLGLPKTIAWYCNDKVVTVTSLESTVINNKTLTYPGNSSNPTGTVYAVVTNVDGKQYKSNSLAVVGTELAAKISNVSVTEDYEGSNIDLKANANRLVISATLNKDYVGTFRVIAANKKEIKDSELALETADVNATSSKFGAIVDTSKIANLVTDVDKKNLTAKYVMATTNLDNGTKAIKYTNPDNSVTYMFTIKGNNGTEDYLVRGDSYKLIFDQASLSSDNISDKDNKTANLSDAFTVPYVATPAKLVVSDVASSIKHGASSSVKGAKATLYTSSDAKTVAKYIDGTAVTLNFFCNNKYITSDGTAMYSDYSANTSKDVRFTAGEYKNTIGVADDTNMVCVYASCKADKGIFGKDAFSMTSAYEIIPNANAGDISVSGSNVSANAVVVSIKGQRSAGTVYLLRKADGTAAYNDDNALTLVDSLNVNDKDSYVAKCDVALTDGGCTFADVCQDIQNTGTNREYGDLYAAVLVPSNAGFAKSTTKTVAACHVIKPVATTYALSSISGKGTAISDADPVTASDQAGVKLTGTLSAKDQFGKDFVGTLPTELTSPIAMVKDSDTGKTVTAYLSIGTDGAVALNIVNVAGLTQATKYKLTTTYGTFRLSVTNEGSIDGNSGDAEVKLTFEKK